MQEYLTVADVAAVLKLSEKTVYRLSQRGEVPGFKAGGSWRYRRLDLEAWVQERLQTARTSRPAH